MAQKTVGYIELEWTCPNCGTQNKGSEAVCTNCGAAQPENVEFHQPVKQELIQDEKQTEQAKASPDIHCAYCGARNPAGTTICTNCGANLGEGKQRVSGRVVGAFSTSQPAEILCPTCGASNPPTAKQCAQCGAALSVPATSTQPASPPPSAARRMPVWIPVLAVAGIGIIIFLVLLFQQKDTTASVSQRMWQRAVVIEQFGPVDHANWRSNLPADAAILSCQQEQRSTSNDPVAGSREVCGTPYTVDKGSGFGEVVSDCVYEVYEDYCKYQADEWYPLQQITSSGQNDSPEWPAAQLLSNQRSGAQSEQYQILFDINGDQKTYITTDYQLYNQAAIGSQWNLTLNGLGQIIDLQISN